MRKISAKEYLNSIHFEDRSANGQWFSNEEMRDILKTKLYEYEEGKVSEGFIIDLAWAFYSEAMTAIDYDENLMGTLCDLSNAKESETARLVKKALDQLITYEKSKNKRI